MKGEREVAGLRCSEVLAELGEYLDGQLSPARRDRIDAHLAGCDVCERFGGDYAGVVQALKGLKPTDADDEAAAFERLAQQMNDMNDVD